MALVEVFTDAVAGGSAGSPKTGDMTAVISYGSTMCFLRMRNTGDSPCHLYWRTPGTTEWDDVQLAPGASADKFFNLTSARTIEYYFDAGSLKFDVAYFFGTTELSLVTTVAKADIEAELQTTLAAGYTDAIIASICSYADSMLQLRTRRSAFTGITAGIAKYAALCLAIDRLATYNRDLVKTAISSISENGSSISFSNGKSIDSYKKEAAEIIADLKLPGSGSYGMTFADTAGVHADSDPGIYDEA